MKKRIMTMLACMALICTMLVGCGGSSDGSSVTGDWTISSIVDADGNSKSLSDYASEAGIDASTLETTYTFKDDGTCTAGIAGVEVSGTYEFKDNTLTMTLSAGGTESTETMTYDADKGELSFKNDAAGTTTILKRK